MAKCLVCENDIPRSNLWPVCSKVCFEILTEIASYKGTSCWISIEVVCRADHCVSRACGKDQVCQVFAVEKAIKEKRLNKQDLIGGPITY